MPRLATWECQHRAFPWASCCVGQWARRRHVSAVMGVVSSFAGAQKCSADSWPSLSSDGWWWWDGRGEFLHAVARGRAKPFCHRLDLPQCSHTAARLPSTLSTHLDPDLKDTLPPRTWTSTRDYHKAQQPASWTKAVSGRL